LKTKEKKYFPSILIQISTADPVSLEFLKKAILASVENYSDLQVIHIRTGPIGKEPLPYVFNLNLDLPE